MWVFITILINTHNCVGMFYICRGYFRVISITKVLYGMDTITEAYSITCRYLWEWRHQIDGWYNCIWRTCGDLLEWSLGNSVWRFLVRFWWNRGLQAIGIFSNRCYIFQNSIISSMTACLRSPTQHNQISWYRCTCLLSCILWPGHWSHPPGQPALQ